MKKIKYILILTLFIASFSMLGCNNSISKEELDISEYLDTSFSGSSGDGSATVYIDYEKLIEKMCSKSDYKNNTQNAIIIQDSVKYNVSRTNGLSNGDKITVNIYITNKINDLDSDYTLKDKSIDLEVKDLEESNDSDDSDDSDDDYGSYYDDKYSIDYHDDELEQINSGTDIKTSTSVTESSDTLYSKLSDDEKKALQVDAVESITSFLGTSGTSYSSAYENVLEYSLSKFTSLSYNDTFTYETPTLSDVYITADSEHIIYIYKSTLKDAKNGSNEIFLPVSLDISDCVEDSVINTNDISSYDWNFYYHYCSSLADACLMKIKANYGELIKIK